MRSADSPVIVAATARVIADAVQCTTVPASAPANRASARSATSWSSAMTKNSDRAAATAVATPSPLRETPNGVYGPRALMIRVSP
ncbi:hypothetical protein SXANM310S_03478 [Streptomyces xanthochromogenes]